MTEAKGRKSMIQGWFEGELLGTFMLIVSTMNIFYSLTLCGIACKFFSLGVPIFN